MGIWYEFPKLPALDINTEFMHKALPYCIAPLLTESLYQQQQLKKDPLHITSTVYCYISHLA